MADAGTVVLGVVSVAGTLGGTLVGARLQASREAREWGRNERKAAFVELLTGLDRLQFRTLDVTNAIQLSKVGDPSWEAVREELAATTKTLEQIDSAISVLLLLIPEIKEAELREVFDSCLSEMAKVADLARARGMRDADLKDVSGASMSAKSPAINLTVYDAHSRVVKMGHRFLDAKSSPK